MEKTVRVVVLSSLILTGCVQEDAQSPSEPEVEPEVTKDESVQQMEQMNESPSFTVENYEMIGEEGRVGLLFNEEVPFIQQTEQKYMWHLWGEPDELEGRFEVIATNAASGEQFTVLEDDRVGGPNNGADAHVPSMISLPTSGIWQLDAYVGGNLFGTVIVEVHEK